MAIALRTGSAVAWTTGTTIVSASMSLTAGDIIIMSCSYNPAALNCTFSKTAGTGAIGTITTRTKITNGVQGLTMAFCSVTTTGTVTITATASSTVTNGVLAIEAYSGGSGVKGGTGGTGAAGTTAPLTINNTYQNSWQVMAVSLVGNAPSVPTAGTNVTAVEQSVASNITGTTNDLAIGIGSHEVATAPGNITLTMNKGNGVTYSADIVELVQQFTLSASGGAAGTQADKASSVFPAGGRTQSAREAASATKIASSVKAAAGTEATSSTRQVLTNFKSVTETESGRATEQVTSNLKSVTETESASASPKVTANSKSVTEIESALALLKASSTKSVTETERASSAQTVPTNFKPNAAGIIQSLASVISGSVKSVQEFISGRATQIASSVVSAEGTMSATANVVAHNPSASSGNDMVGVHVAPGCHGSYTLVGVRL